MKLMRTAAVLVSLIMVAGAQEKTELKYAFQKGEKFPLKFKYGLSVKLDKVPEQFLEILGKNPVELQFEGVVDMEVRDIAESGAAELVGTWKTARAKGHVPLNDIDLTYDAAKAEPEKKEQPGDPGLQGFMNIQDALARVVREPLKLSVDRQGKVTLGDGAGKLGDLEGPFRSLNGLMGPLPLQAVGKGDGWKETLKLAMPGLGGQLDIPIQADSVYASKQTLQGRECVMIHTKFLVGPKAGGKEVIEVPDVGAKVTLEGTGEGKTAFALKEGRAAMSQSLLKGKISITLPNPAGGEDLEIAGDLTVELNHEMGGR